MNVQGRSTLLWLVLLFSAPFVAGWMLILKPELLPERRANHGELLEPVRSVSEIAFPLPGAEPLSLSSLSGRWVLVSVVSRCEEACRRRLWILQQIRLALGEDRGRVERILLWHEVPETAATELRSDFPGIHITPGDGRALDALTGGTLPPDNTLYVIDPMGNLMMRFGPEQSADDILDDMQRLMKVSKHWRNYVSN